MIIHHGKANLLIDNFNDFIAQQLMLLDEEGTGQARRRTQ